MSKSLKVSLTILITLVLVFLVLAILFITKNTSFLTTSIPQQDLDANNQNQNDQTQLPYTSLKSQQIVVSEIEHTLNLPEDFKISVWASGLHNPRQIDFTDDNYMVVADRGSGAVKLIKPSDDNTRAAEVITIDTDLQSIHSVDYYNGDLYTGEESRITVYRGLTAEGMYNKKEVLIENLPADGGHYTRTVRVGPDQKLYITVGSSCNLCEEADERRAAMLVADMDGSNLQVFASGLRNTVDFIFRSTSIDFAIWGVDNGRDLIGDNIPPDEVNIIKQSKNYGWPYCYGKGINNPEYPERAGYCKTETESPTFNLQAHSAALGLTFLVNDNLTQRVKFPQSVFEHDLFMAFHGSWNRTTPTGYKIVRLNTTQSNSKEINFITGWLQDNGQAWGRPVDVKFDKTGDMFISDDLANVIYKVEYVGER